MIEIDITQLPTSTLLRVLLDRTVFFSTFFSSEEQVALTSDALVDAHATLVPQLLAEIDRRIPIPA